MEAMTTAAASASMGADVIWVTKGSWPRPQIVRAMARNEIGGNWAKVLIPESLDCSRRVGTVSAVASKRRNAMPRRKRTSKETRRKSRAERMDMNSPAIAETKKKLKMLAAM